MKTPKKIDEQTVSFLGNTYKKTIQKTVKDKDPEFWDLIDDIDNGNVIIFESDVYLKI